MKPFRLLIKWSLQLDLTQIPIDSLAGELRKRPQILIVSAECGPGTVFRPRLPGQRLAERTNNMSSALRELHTYLSLELRKQIEVSPKRSHTLQVHFSPSLSLFHAFETYETE